MVRRAVEADVENEMLACAILLFNDEVEDSVLNLLKTLISMALFTIYISFSLLSQKVIMSLYRCVWCCSACGLVSL